MNLNKWLINSSSPLLSSPLLSSPLLSSPLSALFGSGFDSDEELPHALPLSSSSRPAYSLPDSDGYFSHGTHTYLLCKYLYVYVKH